MGAQSSGRGVHVESSTGAYHSPWCIPHGVQPLQGMQLPVTWATQWVGGCIIQTINGILPSIMALEVGLYPSAPLDVLMWVSVTTVSVAQSAHNVIAVLHINECQFVFLPDKLPVKFFLHLFMQTDEQDHVIGKVTV